MEAVGGRAVGCLHPNVWRNANESGTKIFLADDKIKRLHILFHSELQTKMAIININDLSARIHCQVLRICDERRRVARKNENRVMNLDDCVYVYLCR